MYSKNKFRYYYFYFVEQDSLQFKAKLEENNLKKKRSIFSDKCNSDSFML